MNNSMQNQILEDLQSKRTNVTAFLMNGFQMRGIVKGFDDNIVVMECDGKENMIYKHAISTISPNPRLVSKTQDKDD